MLYDLVRVATAEVNNKGVFTIPGVVRLQLRTQPAAVAGEKPAFGKVVMVKAT